MQCYVRLLNERGILYSFFFFFNDTATTEIYTLSLHDALPISSAALSIERTNERSILMRSNGKLRRYRDRKSTRLNSSHSQISYAVFCLKKKINTRTISTSKSAPTTATPKASTHSASTSHKYVS